MLAPGLYLLFASAIAGVRANDTWVKGFSLKPNHHEMDYGAKKQAGFEFCYLVSSEWVGNHGAFDNFAFYESWDVARVAGLITGAVFVSNPGDQFSGAEQAKFFVNDGGGEWQPDGKTLPGAVFIPRGPDEGCHGLTPGQFRKWIWDFYATYFILTGRRPVIMVDAITWQHCAGGAWDEVAECPLWINQPGASPAPILPSAWNQYTFWRHSAACTQHTTCTGYIERFRGTSNELRTFAGQFDLYLPSVGNPPQMPPTAQAWPLPLPHNTAECAQCPNPLGWLAHYGDGAELRRKREAEEARAKDEERESDELSVTII